MKIDNFLLMSGVDIPLTSSNIVIHNPTINELATVFLYEDDFLTGFEFLFFSKDRLSHNEQEALAALSDFDILLALLMSDDDAVMKHEIQCVKNLLCLLFKQYDKIEYNESGICLIKDEYTYIIDDNLFVDFKKIINQMFPLKKNKKDADFNPQSRKAKEIAEKLKKGRERVLQQQKAQGINESLFDRYISILSVGLQMSVLEFFNWNVYQLFSIFERYEKKEIYDVHLQAQLAGATGMKEVDHWMM